jgi:hypothetical protein
LNGPGSYPIINQAHSRRHKVSTYRLCWSSGAQSLTKPSLGLLD